jgi:hypothetical protein
MQVFAEFWRDGGRGALIDLARAAVDADKVALTHNHCLPVYLYGEQVLVFVDADGFAACDARDAEPTRDHSGMGVRHQYRGQMRREDNVVFVQLVCGVHFEVIHEGFLAFGRERHTVGAQR